MDNAFEVEIGKSKYKKPSEVAKIFDMPESTLRKYSRVLEEAGYVFRKGEKRMRLYSPADELVLYKMLKRIKEEDEGLAKAAAFAIDGQGSKVTDTDLTSSVAEGLKPSVHEDSLKPFLEQVLKKLTYIEENTVNKQEFNEQVKLMQKALDENVELRRQNKEKDEQLEFMSEKFDRVMNLLERNEREKEIKKKGFMSRWFGS
ncbi:winged helix-turn-helix domain-containing protein [Priestia megaterium]|uniref:winged helix-turn-helix domain-containing protein n=1 Tax=Priestia megaterium TaxID=1404 RepID=UPI002FFEA66D